MEINTFLNALSSMEIDHFFGVPDSQLRAFCDSLYLTYGISANFVVAQNEGGALSMAAGYHLATGKVPCVFMQNSGIGNAVNPICSLIHPKVYGIPVVFVVGWRGQPGVKDEPQHVFQGEITKQLLEELEIKFYIIHRNTTAQEVREWIAPIRKHLEQGESVAFIVEKNAFETKDKACYKNPYMMTREWAIEQIVDQYPDSIFVVTTGKASREMFEIRERRGDKHKNDFLTVGSMGHSSLLALEIAEQKTNQTVICLDGDGAVLMHMGAMAVIGSRAPENFVHVLLNNEAHESVGGMPTVANKLDFPQIALGCGYLSAYSVAEMEEWKTILENLHKLKKPAFIEIKVALDARDNLGRPTIPPQENKAAFMKMLKDEKK